MANKIKSTNEELELLVALSNSQNWVALKRSLSRYVNNIMVDSMKLKMSVESDRHAHSNYTGQVDAVKFLIKHVEGSSKRLDRLLEKQKEKEKGGKKNAS